MEILPEVDPGAEAEQIGQVFLPGPWEENRDHEEGGLLGGTHQCHLGFLVPPGSSLGDRPAWKVTSPRHEEPDRELPDDDGPGITLMRWVERPDGELEQVAMPLTPELFLHSQLGDHMSQGMRHSNTARRIADRLEHHFRAERDVLVMTRAEEEELRKAAEERARAAEEKAAHAEAELERLRTEIARLRGD